MKQYKFNKEELLNIGIDDRNYKDLIVTDIFRFSF